MPTRAILAYLDEAARTEYESLKDTPQGRREFEAIIVWEGDQAIMTEDQVDKALKSGPRILAQLKKDKELAKKDGYSTHSFWDKTVVSIDHAVGNIEREERSRSGIIVMSRFHMADRDRAQGFIHADRTESGRSDKWIPAAVDAYYEFGADEMVVESNQGGNLIKEAIHKYDPKIRVWATRAHKDKAERAIFAQQLAAQGCFHFGTDLPELQEELMSFTGERGPKVPKTDRADAFVQAARRLFKRREAFGTVFGISGADTSDDADTPPAEWLAREQALDTPPPNWDPDARIY